jgi:antitoxin (DNA-binding transcriptional repressor) of toxin-antitoxin stability system
MATIKAVGVRELKNKLSAYLQEVRLGTVVLVLDRNEVVAELRQATLTPPLESRQPLLDDLIHRGHVHPPLTARSKCARSPLRASSGTTRQLLDADRGE